MSRYAVEGYYVEGYAADEDLVDFIWKYHQVGTSYPESGRRMELGGGYMFSAEPDGPDQRIFNLTFETMIYFVGSDGAVDKSVFPEINFAALEDFYTSHRLWRTFTYAHPVYGPLNVKFAKPLEVPRGIADGNGALESFNISLIEIP